MVLSKINSEISYQELKTIDENDKGRDVSMYQINLFILSMGIIYIIILPFIMDNKLYNFKKYIKK